MLACVLYGERPWLDNPHLPPPHPLLTLMEVMTLRARARMSWLAAAKSFWKELMDSNANSRHVTVASA